MYLINAFLILWFSFCAHYKNKIVILDVQTKNIYSESSNCFDKEQLHIVSF